MSHRYHPEIDGLRAIAVLPVMLFHAHIPGFSGGYVGVDVFFVISGFLITSILIRDMREGRYSVLSFYERRIRRIAPSLLVVLAFVLIAAPAILLPSEFRRLSSEVLGALLFVANIVFFLDSGYFSSNAETRPLLHTWSLGVEEQFYIVAPIAIWIVIRFFSRHLFATLSAAAIISFVACVVITPVQQSAAFYLLPTRAWELLSGSLLAALTQNESASLTVGSEKTRTLYAASGLALIAASVVFYDSSMDFPGLAALAPVVGSCLIIRYAAQTVVGSILCWPPLVFVGLVSYSLYLWHWPLTVFFRDLGWLDDWAGKLSLVGTSLIAASLSWHLVERNTRDRSKFPTKRLLITVCATSAAVVLTSLFYHDLDGWPTRFRPQVVADDSARHDISPSRARCHINSGVRPAEEFCSLGHGKPSIAVWADSHGVELAQAIAENGIPVIQITYSACRPSLSAISSASRPGCDRHNMLARRFLASSTDVTTAVLVANYSGSTERLQGLLDVADYLRRHGKRVVLIGPMPSLPGRIDLPTYLARGGRAEHPYVGISGHEIRGSAGEIEVLLPEELFCANGVCDLRANGSPILFDSHHPSMSAARVVAGALTRCLSQGSCR